ncbi:tRNA lysidine(34) synthetase TilS [Pseudooceanicola sp. LIPI14-2-Ac024]|uniref:tRNA lysidine(34) synthetase TilS n=1 Tax=Pseudooceanicola sp. LIPI14-2-Ac024 TaxID=3344875 RepID=UPI0035CEFD79
MRDGDPAAAEPRLRETILSHLLPDPPVRLGVAVSGGGDSTALLLLLSDIAADRGIALHVVTVDHGLRPEAPAEAAQVAALAARLGHPHSTLRWTGWDGQGNTQDAARRARFDLIAAWAREGGIPVVALGHTADDQAETVLMRLARASGADGLSGMPLRRVHDNVTFLRPMLDLRRAELREMLRRRGQDWIEDPSNDDPAYDRIRIRQALDALAPLGLTVPALATVAGNSAAIRATLDHYALAEARACVTFDRGDILMDRGHFAALLPEMQRRLLIAALRWLTGAAYPPRRRPLAMMLDAIAAGQDMTLAGCRALVGRETLRLTREAAALTGQIVAPGAVWDGRWRLAPPPGDVTPKGAEIRPLTLAGVADCPGWRDTALPRATLAASPAAWHGARLLAAPLAGRAEGWRLELTRDQDTFFGFFASH